VLLISQTFPNLSLVGAEACVLSADSMLSAISGLLRLKRSCQINARRKHTPAAGIGSVPLLSKTVDRFWLPRAQKFIFSSGCSVSQRHRGKVAD
jgi:hypothetical protein